MRPYRHYYKYRAGCHKEETRVKKTNTVLLGVLKRGLRQEGNLRALKSARTNSKRLERSPGDGTRTSAPTRRTKKVTKRG